MMKGLDPCSLNWMIRRLRRSEMSQLALPDGEESFDESRVRSAWIDTEFAKSATFESRSAYHLEAPLRNKSTQFD